MADQPLSPLPPVTPSRCPGAYRPFLSPDLRTPPGAVAPLFTSRTQFVTIASSGGCLPRQWGFSRRDEHFEHPVRFHEFHRSRVPSCRDRLLVLAVFEFLDVLLVNFLIYTVWASSPRSSAGICSSRPAPGRRRTYPRRKPSSPLPNHPAGGSPTRHERLIVFGSASPAGGASTSASWPPWCWSCSCLVVHPRRDLRG